MTRAAIYARFSTDLQNQRSIDDQVALCRALAESEDLAITATYSDRARSGASVIGRDGLMQLMDAARDGAFDVVLVEALDRISRDQEDLAGIWKRLRFLGIEIRTVHEGTADEIQVGVRGLVGALYLQDLAHKIRRGMTGVVTGGRHAGGRAYGYRPVAGRPGELEIVEEEAAVVREIFTAYVDGATPRKIAAGLNERGVAPPRGVTWMASAINGSRSRRSGILNNELYAGRIVWNKVRMVKNPDTGRRISRPNPPGEWQSVGAPHLRIIGDDLFHEAQAIKDSRGGERPHHARKPKHLLSGLLKCGTCGGGLSVKDRRNGRTRVQCTRMKEGGGCGNRRSFHLEKIERIVVDGLRGHLEDPALIADYAEAYNDERRRLARAATAERTTVEKSLGRVTRELDRAVDAIIKDLVDPESLRGKIKQLEAEKRALTERLNECDAPVELVALHPTALQRYREQIEDLQKAITGAIAAGDDAPANALRALVETVVVHSDPASDAAADVEVRGRLSALVGHDLFPSATFGGGSVVAEDRYSRCPPSGGPLFSLHLAAS